MTHEASCEEEAVRLHVFLEKWLTGAIPRTEGDFASFSSVFLQGFTVIGPSGATTERSPLLDEFEALHGKLADKADRFRIEVRNFAPVARLGEAVCATYEEWHTLAGRRSARVSTALFEPLAGAPHGVGWRHIHETWLPGLAPPAGERLPEEE